MASLYADLVETTEAQELKQVQEELANARAMIAQQANELSDALEEISELKEENQTLKTNLSAIYHTAKKEIQRKDGMIAELRNQLAAANSTTAPSPPMKTPSVQQQHHRNTYYSHNENQRDSHVPASSFGSVSHNQQYAVPQQLQHSRPITPSNWS